MEINYKQKFKHKLEYCLTLPIQSWVELIEHHIKII